MRSSMRPALSRFVPTDGDFFCRNAFLIVKLSKLPFAIRAIIASHNRRLKTTVYYITFLLLFVSHFTQVLECFDISVQV